ncbi:uncharacterized protein EAE98_000256 [Botrytis deweyae]|uniref:Uncharacterized protein n=1 Tax=Botrytis deweyae TaxID=2478750 RepID=A0ABQ7J278_9HELO|nr:uncharacterized protein EAE98_000256 [Botrytis deweyae]KAF7940129.1 hypothetical protein EAE98_000256 [Botrytis deweyae]
MAPVLKLGLMAPALKLGLLGVLRGLTVRRGCNNYILRLSQRAVILNMPETQDTLPRTVKLEETWDKHHSLYLERSSGGKVEPYSDGLDAIEAQI